MATAALFGRPVHVPVPLSRVISVLVGISLGAVVSPETLKGLAAFPLSVLVLAISTLCMITATSSYLRFVHGWDAQSALFGASPGALAQVMTLASEYKADLRAIAIVQTMRVVALTLGIPAGLSYFGLTLEGGGLMARFVAAGPPSIPELAILVVASTATALVVFKLRLPGGLMFGAMLASAILHGGGFIHSILPWWVAYAAVIGIGAVTGSRFANTDPLHVAALPRRGAGLVRGGDDGRVAVGAGAGHADVGAAGRRGAGLRARRAGHHDGAGAGAAPRSGVRRRAATVALPAGVDPGAVPGAPDQAAAAGRQGARIRRARRARRSRTSSWID